MADPYLGYCLDEAVHAWGTYVEAEVDEAGSKGRKDKDRAKNRTRKLGELLKLPDEQRFKSFRQSAGRAPMKE